MKNMGDYHDHYFDTCSRFYKLDPCHYLSFPGLSWNAMLKLNGVRLKKISDIEIYSFLENGLRGGISYFCERHGKANNKYLKNVDPTKPSKFISDLDMSNLYSWGMRRFRPYREFKWFKKVDNFDVNLISENSSIGYILEIDFEYPNELHKLHNDYSLAPKKLTIPCVRLLQKDCRQIWNKSWWYKKLIPNLGDKTNYVVHCRNLQLYLSLRM